MRMPRTLIVLAVCGLLAGCAAGGRAPVLPLPQDFTLELPQSGGRFVLLQGEEVRVRLPASHSTGYRWSLVTDSPAEALKLVQEPVYEADGTMPGRGGSEVWHFRAAGSGTAVLNFTYRRPQAATGTPDRTATYNFEVR